MEVSTSYSMSKITNVIGGQINYTKDGIFGFGAFYQHGNNPSSNAVGIQGEYALGKPLEGTSPGLNLLGALGMSWATMKVGDDYNFTQSVTSQSAALGFEIYLHVKSNKIRIEPFFQFLRTFSKISLLDNLKEVSNNISQNSFSIGMDVYLLDIFNNSLLLTPGMTFIENSNNAFIMSMSFVHRFN